jgi:CDP-diacylglycerol pyrophosphatase
LPQALLTPQDILLRRKEGKYQAFLMVPTTKVEEICALKELSIANNIVFVRRWFANYQVFVGRLPETLALEDVTSAISSQFGRIIKYEEVQPH